MVAFKSRHAGVWLPSPHHFLAESTGGVPAGLVLSTVLEPWILGLLLGFLYGYCTSLRSPRRSDRHSITY